MQSIITPFPTSGLVTSPGAGPSLHGANVPDLPSTDMKVEVIDSADSLRSLIPQWERLVEMSGDRNSFYEPAFAIPAARHLAGETDLRFVFVSAPPRVNPAAARLICGMFPIVVRRHMNGIPVVVSEMWRHDQAYLTTPLIRRDVMKETWLAFWQWLQTSHLVGKRRCDWFVLPMMAADGPFHGMLVDWCESESIPALMRRRYRRAIFHRCSSFDAYEQSCLSGKSRQEARRRKRNLEKSHRLQIRECSDSQAMENFLRLENQGWKGHDRTSLLSREMTSRFAREMATAMNDCGRLQIIEMIADDQVIASKVNLTSFNGGFAWKIAFDESWASCSPGNLLELELIRKLHDSATTEWLDSCAEPDHPMINHLWRGRRSIESMIMACGTKRGRWMLAIRPLLQALSRRNLVNR